MSQHDVVGRHLQNILRRDFRRRKVVDDRFAYGPFGASDVGRHRLQLLFAGKRVFDHDLRIGGQRLRRQHEYAVGIGEFVARFGVSRILLVFGEVSGLGRERIGVGMDCGVERPCDRRSPGPGACRIHPEGAFVTDVPERDRPDIAQLHARGRRADAESDRREHVFEDERNSRLFVVRAGDSRNRGDQQVLLLL